jgi:methylthioribose-1-phosphate isomerase
MNVNGTHYRTIWLLEPERRIVRIINQQTLPFSFEILDLCSLEDARRAIKDMYVRGAGLIGAAAALIKANYCKKKSNDKTYKRQSAAG